MTARNYNTMPSGFPMLFHKSLYQFDTPQPSWWEADFDSSLALPVAELGTEEKCDVAIIGGGYTGLSAAYHLVRDHSLDVRVLEAGHIGWGASGRNGGFCCMGGTMRSDSSMVAKFGLEEVKRYADSQREAVELVRSLLVDEQISAELVGDCEMEVAEKPEHFKHLAEVCEFRTRSLGMDCRMIPPQEFRETCYDAPHQHGAFAMAPGFGIHPLKYCQGLASAASRKGAIIYSRSPVQEWSKSGGMHELRTPEGSVKARHVILACNAFMPEYLDNQLVGRVLPLQSHVVVTRKLSNSELDAHGWKTSNPAINSRNVYSYFRMLPDKRLLIGSRADFDGNPQGAMTTRDRLHRSIGKFWPEWRDVELEYSWRGLVCFTRSLRPAIGRLADDPSVYMAYGFHGNGVNTATWAGSKIADWMMTANDANNLEPSQLPAMTRGISGKIPFPRLRRLYAKAGVAWHHFKDRLDGLH